MTHPTIRLKNRSHTITSTDAGKNLKKCNTHSQLKTTTTKTRQSRDRGEPTPPGKEHPRNTCSDYHTERSVVPKIGTRRHAYSHTLTQHGAGGPARAKQARAGERKEKKRHRVGRRKPCSCFQMARVSTETPEGIEKPKSLRVSELISKVTGSDKHKNLSVLVMNMWILKLKSKKEKKTTNQKTKKNYLGVHRTKHVGTVYAAH